VWLPSRRDQEREARLTVGIAPAHAARIRGEAGDVARAKARIVNEYGIE
jgi:hypothetical protein